MVKQISFLILLFLLILSFSFAENSEEDLLRGSGYSRQEQKMLQNALDKGEEQGIDRTMLYPRIKEAKSKKVSAERLLSALENEIKRLVSAEIILSQSSEGKRLLKTRASWQRTANLLSWGAEKKEIQIIIRACGTRPENYKQATILFVSLVSWGLDRRTALDLTEAAAMSDLSGGDFPGIQELLVRGRGKSIPPRDLALEIIKALPEIADFTSLRERILYE